MTVGWISLFFSLFVSNCFRYGEWSWLVNILTIHRILLNSTLHSFLNPLLVIFHDLYNLRKMLLIIQFYVNQTPMLKLLLYHPQHWWQQTDLYVRYATRGSKGTKTFSCIGEVIICHGSWGKEQPTRSGKESTYAPSHRVSTTTRLER